MYKSLRFYIAAFLCLWLFHSEAQNTFYKTYSAQKNKTCTVSKHINTDLCQTCVLGDTTEFVNANYAIFKVDTNGEITFSKELLISHAVFVIYSYTNPDGSIIVFCGTTNNDQLEYDDLIIFKMDVNEIIEWSYLYSVDGLPLNITMADNSYYLTGMADKDVNGDLNDILVMRISLDGDLLWAKKFGWEGVEQSYNLFADNKGKITICGNTTSYGAGAYDWVLLSIDSLGNALWSKTYGGISDEQPYYIRQNSQKEFIVAGYSLSYSLDLTSDIYVIKTDSIGNLLWSKTYGGSDNDGLEFNGSASGISDIHKLLCVTTSFGFGSFDILLMELDNSGEIVFAKCYGSSLAEAPQYLIEDAENLYLPGIVVNDSISQSLIKTDLYGNSGCNEMNVVPTITDVVTEVNTVFPEMRTTGTRDTFIVVMKDIFFEKSLICSCDIDVNFTYSMDTLTANFTNNSLNATSYWWDFGDGITSTEYNPVHEYDSSGTYIVSLVGIDAGCLDTVKITITIEPLPSDIIIPNVFTPNGDGNNDLFEIKNLSQLSRTTIYNRWGQIVLDKTNYLNNWDAQDVSGGVYYYVLSLPNGEKKKGFVQVIK